MKYVVAVTAVESESILNLTKPLIERYCEKTNSDLFIINKPVYSITNVGYNYLKFEKNQVYNLFDVYDKVLRLDVDIVVNPNCPNYFDLDKSFLYVSQEFGREKEVEIIQNDLGIIKDWNNFYFNSGVVLASKEHKEAFNISDIDFNKGLGLLKEQNVLNWKVSKLGFKLVDLGPSFNYINGPKFENDSIRRNANFIHHTLQGTGRKLNSIRRDVNFFSNINSNKI